MEAVDHVIVTVRDPEGWATELRARTGLVAVPGGEHEGLGTGNWIAPLDGSYLELMTVVDPDLAAASALGRWVQARLRDGDGLGAVCLRTDDIEAVADRIDAEPLAMSRRTADDRVLSWRLAGLDAALSDERLPFFIQWDGPATDHPSTMPVDHDVTPGPVTEVAWGGDPGRLDAWLGDHDLALRHVDGPPGPREVVVETDRGPVRITADGLA